jgi:predicted RNase H-like nuclease (RuvC/YqgF family)
MTFPSIPARDDSDDGGLDAAKSRLDALGGSPVQMNIGGILAKYHEQRAHEQDVVREAGKRLERMHEEGQRHHAEMLAREAEKASNRKLVAKLHEFEKEKQALELKVRRMSSDSSEKARLETELKHLKSRESRMHSDAQHISLEAEERARRAIEKTHNDVHPSSGTAAI